VLDWWETHPIQSLFPQSQSFVSCAHCVFPEQGLSSAPCHHDPVPVTTGIACPSTPDVALPSCNMAYSPVAQRERPTSPDFVLSSVLSSSSARPPSIERDELDGITGAADPSSSRLSSLIRSITSTRSSYDMVEDDDYEEPQVALSNVSRHEDENQPTPTRVRDPQRPYHSSSPQRTVPYPTASISRDTPLRHPAPDLQSLQGAYVKNVERLEESAERLSVTSSLEEELQKMKLEPTRQSSARISRVSPVPIATRQFSSGSATNSIIDLHTAARSGGYSPTGYVTSPRESAFSGSWSQPSAQGRPTSKGSRLASGQTEPIRKRTPLDFSPLTSPSVLVQPQSPENAYHGDGLDHPAGSKQDRPHQQEENAQDRPHTSASNDTYHQVTDLFADFDGIHFTPHNQLSLSIQASPGRQVPLSQPPLASDSKPFREPQPGERMVYYPAPVPMMLNLPQKLSKEPAGRRERRRLQGINEIPDEMRKSAAWLQGEPADQLGSGRSTQALAGLPPQLRASAFFDQPAATQHVVVKEASAVATLDSILDASAHAPVSAFTDHPIVGNVGKEVYGKAKPQRKSEAFEKAEKKKRNSSFSNMLRTSTGLTSGTRLPSGEMPNTSQGRIESRESKAFEGEEDAADAAGEFTPLRASDDLARAAEQSISPEDDELLDDEDQDKEDDEEEDDRDDDDDDMNYIGPPTTLLAELQMRKAQQKQRNRTAATAFPNGMHATLLELDAIAQLQQKSRKQKHVTLAWEDRELADRQNFDDEDVPLAMLVPQSQDDVNRPIGLMERRDIEDNEPLSRRRARIRGEPFRPHGLASTVQNDTSSLRTLEKSGLEEEVVDEQEGETLAQRLKRLKAQKEPPLHVATDFAAEVSSQLGLKMEPAVAPSKTPDAEETLGQRRKRLQQEALSKKQDVGGGNSQELPNPVKPEPIAPNMRQNDRMLGSQAIIPHLGTQDENVPLSQLRNQLAMQGAAPMQIPYSNAVPYANGAFNYGTPMIYSPTTVQPYYGVNGGPVYTRDPMMGPPLDPKQRIDNWRQGVVR
jgi:hypothetical protein